MLEHPTFVLGVHSGHNATAVLLYDGAVVACASEERFTGRKNESGLPMRSIAYVLRAANVGSRDLSGVAFATRWRAGIFDPVATIRSPALRVLRHVHGVVAAIRWHCERAFPPARSVSRRCENAMLRALGGVRTHRERTTLAATLNISTDLMRAFDHHVSHAAVAYYGSPYNGEDALVFTIDAEGDFLSATVSVVQEGAWTRIAATSSDASLGWLYFELTGYLGMKRNEHEYKVMGLAPYAKADDVQRIYDRISGLITLDPREPLRFRSTFDTRLTRWFLQREMRERRFDSVAGAFQRLVEERLCEWVREGVRRTGIRTVCLGGGVAMNVKANLRIAELPEVERFWPCPSAGDESTAMGAAYLAYGERCSDAHLNPPKDLYLGPDVSHEEIVAAFDTCGADINFRIAEPTDITEAIAELLAAGDIVARCAGRMEWGARALGNRSILADPSNTDIVRHLNEQVKSRDFWMPFAPSILAERAREYLVNPKDLAAPYMALAFRVTPVGERHLRAAMHPYDRTVRPQVVEREANSEYHRLIRAFERRTGIGAVLNTSFNIHGEPIVCGAREALDVFSRSGLRHLALGRFLISKRS
ncbi:hypothetical protein HY635_01135 [Candidatus Uhrbacteria bacterium]|nr:hypothetical protein [Candidatus Uhrbacteria bacterium]